MSVFLPRAAVAAVALSVLALAGCETPAGKVDILQSSSTSVVAGSTYAWAPVTSATQRSADPRIANDIINQRIQSAVDSALAAKGYRRVSSPSQATLLVSYYVGLEARSEIQSNNMGPPPVAACGFRGCVGGWGFYGAPMLDVETINYTQGTMIVDLVDRASGQLAWRATSNRRVDSSDADQAALNAVAADMVKTLPGGAQ
ncbi:DUF4136 domain-containing protein [Brevundimonas goettingensis]|uniref:DUF4136 domain-containing protein n=1 Tax=Brevundimonas goettingensis TaxID=2774190 RepID=A0A975C2P5_9CAUL|nr:DUF4136 domain-containing protein [Brevundimonas goettingensis]QTC90231.1 DUF4136 domain-containing protein [Brevundimonas goettingensis]